MKTKTLLIFLLCSLSAQAQTPPFTGGALYSPELAADSCGNLYTRAPNRNCSVARSVLIYNYGQKTVTAEYRECDSFKVTLTHTAAQVDSMVNAAVLSAAFVLPKDEPRNQDAYNWKRGALVAGFGFIGGAAMGIHETAVHKPWNFPSSWNPQYWDESLAWRNKWKNGDPQQGPKFPLSTSALAWTTSAKHTSGTIHRAAILGAGITIGFGELRPWWHYAADAVLGFAAYSTAFHMGYTYNVWKRK